MVEENVYIVIGVIVGTITGSSSLTILLYKIWREKPRLIFTIENAVWYIHHPDAKIITFSILMRIDNKGERNTTVHTANLSFEYEGKKYHTEIRTPSDLLVVSNGSIRKQLEYHLPRDEVTIEDVIEKSTLSIEHTRGIKIIEIPTIKKSDFY